MLPRIPLPPVTTSNNVPSLSSRRAAVGTSSSTASGGGGIGGKTNSFNLPPLNLANIYNINTNKYDNNQTTTNTNGTTTSTITTNTSSSRPIPKPPQINQSSPRSVLSALVNPHPISKSILANRGVNQQQRKKTTVAVVSSSTNNSGRKPNSSSSEDVTPSSFTSTSTTTTTPRLPIPVTITTSSNGPTTTSSGNSNSAMASMRARGVGLAPNDAIIHFEDKLAPFEIDELQRQDESGDLAVRRVYFAGLDQRRKLFSLSSYDDENCDYKTIPGDHIAFRYEILGYLGKGSFGQVVKALDHKTGDTVALKVIKNKKKFHEQAAIERHMLEYLNQYGGSNENESVFIRLRDSFTFRGHCVFVFDLHGLNLYDRLKASNFASTPMYLIQQYARQLLQALEFTHKHGIVHCDIKPENILVVKNSNVASIRLIDFGSSCFMNARIHTYIQSRFYRAPEICLGLPYTPTIDTWSLGCVLYELFFGSPLFAVQSEADLIGQISSRLGPLPQHLYERAPRKKHFFEVGAASQEAGGGSSGGNPQPRLKKIRSSYAKLQRLDAMFVAPGSSQQASEMAQLGDLICRMVRWDPAARIAPSEALLHPFLTRADIAPPRSLLGQLGGDDAHQTKSSRTKRTASQRTSTSSQLLSDIYNNNNSSISNHAPLTSRKQKYVY